MNKLKENLKELRINENLTQEDMAKMLNMSATGYASYEQGKAEPSIDTLITLARFFKVSIDELVGNE